MRCFACTGVYHPSSGHLFKGFDDVAYCGRCIRHFYGWMKGHMKRKWSGADFYLEAVTSIRADREPMTAEDVRELLA